MGPDMRVVGRCLMLGLLGACLACCATASRPRVLQTSNQPALHFGDQCTGLCPSPLKCTPSAGQAPRCCPTTTQAVGGPCSNQCSIGCNTGLICDTSTSTCQVPTCQTLPCSSSAPGLPTAECRENTAGRICLCTSPLGFQYEEGSGCVLLCPGNHTAVPANHASALNGFVTGPFTLDNGLCCRACYDGSNPGCTGWLLAGVQCILTQLAPTNGPVNPFCPQGFATTSGITQAPGAGSYGGPGPCATGL